MPLTTDQREQVANEIKKFAGDLNLTEDQKTRLRGFMEQAREKVQAYRSAHPNASNADIVREIAQHREELRAKVVSFLTPDQLTKWDSAVKNAKEFLGEKLAA